MISPTVKPSSPSSVSAWQPGLEIRFEARVAEKVFGGRVILLAGDEIFLDPAAAVAGFDGGIFGQSAMWGFDTDVFMGRPIEHVTIGADGHVGVDRSIDMASAHQAKAFAYQFTPTGVCGTIQP